MRRKQNEITDQGEIEKILTEGRVGRLATLGADGYPYITPVNYVYWQGAIYFHCALTGEKLDNIDRHHKVCFEVDFPLAYLDTGYDQSMPACEVTQLYQCVIIRGLAECVMQTDEKVAALNALMASHEGVADFSDITARTPAVAAIAVVAIRVESLSCKVNVAQVKSEEEKEKIRTHLQTRGLPGDKEAAGSIK